MKLDDICWKVAGQALSEPGTLVERMGPNVVGLKKGLIYEVVGYLGYGILKIKGGDGYLGRYNVENFRKAIV